MSTFFTWSLYFGALNRKILCNSVNRAHFIWDNTKIMLKLYLALKGQMHHQNGLGSKWAYTIVTFQIRPPPNLSSSTLLSYSLQKCFWHLLSTNWLSPVIFHKSRRSRQHNQWAKWFYFSHVVSVTINKSPCSLKYPREIAFIPKVCLLAEQQAHFWCCSC